MVDKVAGYVREFYFLDEVYAVGGSVRDALLGKEAHDIDLAAKLRPPEIIEKLEGMGYNVWTPGLKHGTVTTMSVDGTVVEITTFRKDVSTDGRHADVEYANTIEEDLARRDFTINAIAMNGEGGIVDPYGGAFDLKARKLRTVGHPWDRFKEDYLRILRGFRIAANLNFTLREDVKVAAIAYAPDILKYVSVERIKEEFEKAFWGNNVDRFLRNMYYIGFLQHYLPATTDWDKLKQHPVYHPEGNVLEHVIKVVKNAPPQYRWHALLHDIGKASTAEKKEVKINPYSDIVHHFYSFHAHEKIGAEMIPHIAKRLKIGNDLKNELIATTGLHMQPLHMWRNSKELSPRNIRKFQVACGSHLEAVEAVVRADRTGREGPTGEFLDKLFTPVPEEIKPVLMGRDLIKAGFQPGPAIGEMLKYAFDYQIDTGEIDRTKLFVYAVYKYISEQTKPLAKQELFPT